MVELNLEHIEKMHDTGHQDPECDTLLYNMQAQKEIYIDISQTLLAK